MSAAEAPLPAVEVVRSLFAAYLAQDRPAMERLLADDFVFTSPHDDHLGKDAFLTRCFPTADRFRSYELLDTVPVGDGEVFVRYAYELVGGGHHRNVEVLTVRDGRIAETQVYFGGSFPPG
ncbi:nuclear transport factor 2 family protein [Streptomyces sp. NPDC014733]|uniref:nuclear transport factor 2 family protein n=1 Tax=Streptomyces sp. NPDC014733 TaxID=3364885 RepID=UPI003702D5B6